MCWVCLGCGAPELIFLVLEQNVEGGQRTVRAGDILLHLHLFGVAKLRMGVNFLFEHTQVITDHDDFVEEDVERHFFCLQRRIARMKHNPAFVPTRSELFDIRITSRKTESVSVRPLRQTDPRIGDVNRSWHPCSRTQRPAIRFPLSTVET